MLKTTEETLNRNGFSVTYVSGFTYLITKPINNSAEEALVIKLLTAKLNNLNPPNGKPLFTVNKTEVYNPPKGNPYPSRRFRAYVTAYN